MSNLFPLFTSQKHGDILIVGRYPEGETFGGTDRLSYKTIKLFREFIDRQQPKYKHIIVEGDRFFRGVDLEWIVENHDTKVFVLTVDSDEEKRRHVERNDTQSEVYFLADVHKYLTFLLILISWEKLRLDKTILLKVLKR